MAITSGQGNPRWTYEETVLALALYLDNVDKVPGPHHPKVIALSELLRALPYHLEEAKLASFRNPDGVAFKLQNLRAAATGEGLQNFSKMDRRVWDELGSKPEKAKELAKLIEKEAIIDSQLSKSEYDSIVDETEVFPEGKTITIIHKKKERHPGIRPSLIKARTKGGNLKCDICGYTHSNENMRASAFEVHHIVPHSELSERETTLEDVSLLCATCHRLIHRAMQVHDRWLSIEDAKGIILP